jgi:hypothetical protein
VGNPALRFQRCQDSQAIMFWQIQIQSDNAWFGWSESRPVISDKTKGRLCIPQYSEFEWLSKLAQSATQDFDIAMVVINDDHLSWILESM